MSSSSSKYDAIVVGSGPNGLSAAITIARAGHSVLVIEGQSVIGGSTRSAELTLPDFTHDVCSAVHPLGVSSPFFSSLPLAEHGLKWIEPPVPLAHPLDDGTAVLVSRSVRETAGRLGEDRKRYSTLMEPLASGWPAIAQVLANPMSAVRTPWVMTRFGLRAAQSASHLARRFKTQQARALFAGHAAHSMLPLEWVPSGAFALVLGATAHAVGWPFARGGSQSIANALGSYLKSLGGEIVTNQLVGSIEDLPPARAYLFDVTPRQLVKIAASRLSRPFRQKLEKYRYGPGACKVDWALGGPLPWSARECSQAGTVHIGGSLEEIEESERAPWQGVHVRHPFVLLAQPTLFDDTRAPAGKHLAWAYCHVPSASSTDMVDRVEEQVERFAPGFRKLILKRHVMVASSLAAENPNLIDGDIGGGANNLRQLLFRPTRLLYSTSANNIFLCSSSTPPGAGVHGLCGYRAARRVLDSLLRTPRQNTP